MNDSAISSIGASERRAASGAPLVYVVVLNYNGPELTLNCVDSVLKIDYPNFRVIVVDNASADDSLARFREAFTDPRIEILANPKNEGYAGGNNRGMERALMEGADYIFVLNNDTTVEPGCLGPLVDAMQGDNSLGACGCPIFNIGPRGEPNFGEQMSLFSARTKTWRDAAGSNGCERLDYICGAAVLLRSAALRVVGMFDANLFLFYEDADLGFRIRRAGFRIRVIDSPGVDHLLAQTTGRWRPRTMFCAVRNGVWFVRRYGNWRHRAVFSLINLFWLFPTQFARCLLKGRWALVRSLLSGYWAGYARRVPAPENDGLRAAAQRLDILNRT